MLLTNLKSILRRLSPMMFGLLAIGLGLISYSHPAHGEGTPISSIIGQHIVRAGETLYCIGRAYGVVPSAIAQANGLGTTALLSPGQVLSIPAEQWVSIPPGPVCAAQFASPFSGSPAPAATRPAAAPTRIAVGGLGQHIVQPGETLYCIGRAYGVLPTAIAQANNLTHPFRLSPGSALTIPAIRWAFTPHGPVCVAQFPSPFVGGTVPEPTPTNSGLLPTGASPNDTPTSRPTITATPTHDPGPTKTPAPTRTPVATKMP